MTLADMGPMLGYYLGSWAIGYCAGHLYLIFRKVAETAT